VQKAGSGRYDKDTAVLVSVNTHRPWRFDSRQRLVAKTYDFMTKHHPAINGAYYCYVRDFIIDEVKETSYWLL
jgi:hypothetical protein